MLRQGLHVSKTMMPLPTFMVEIFLYINIFNFFICGTIVAFIFTSTDTSMANTFWVSSNIINAAIIMLVSLLLGSKNSLSTEEEHYFNVLPISTRIRKIGIFSNVYLFLFYVLIGSLGHFYGTNLMAVDNFSSNESTDFLNVNYAIILLQFAMFVVLVMFSVYLVEIISRERVNPYRKYSNWYIAVTAKQMPLNKNEKIGLISMGIFLLLALFPSEFIEIQIPKFLLYPLLLTPGALVNMFYAPSFLQSHWFIPIISTLLIFYGLVNLTGKKNIISIPYEINESDNEVKTQITELYPSITNLRYLMSYLLISVCAIILLILDKNIIAIYTSAIFVLQYKKIQDWVNGVFTDEQHSLYLQSLPVNWKKYAIKLIYRIFLVSILNLSVVYIVALYFEQISMLTLGIALFLCIPIFLLMYILIHLQIQRFQISVRTMTIGKLLTMVVFGTILQLVVYFI